MKKRQNKTYKKVLTKKQKQKEIFKIQLTVLGIITFIAVSYIQGYGVLARTDIDNAFKSPESLTESFKPEKGNNTPEEKIEPQESLKMTELITDNPVEQQIYLIADEMGRPEWGEYLVKLAYCESRLDPKAVNSQGNNPADSVDRGLFQYNSYWQSQVSDECAFSVNCSVRKTIEFIEKGKQNLWVCDKYVKGVPIEVVINK